MPPVKIFWDPQGVQVDQLGSRELLRTTDGDTPFISVSIRMLSIDAPEVHYPNLTPPSAQDQTFKQLADWIQAGKAPINSGLAAYLHPRLATGTAGTLQQQQGEAATAHFNQLIKDKLTRPNGSKRRVFIRAANQHFDQYGRLLAYLSPEYSADELAHMSRRDRATFNLLMVDDGWAASFPIYPSIPRYVDLLMLYQSALDAFNQKRGIWAEPLTLAGYEFRMCVRLHDITKRLVAGEKLSTADRESWIERYCADMTTLEIFEPQEYYGVPPPNRLFIWPQDVSDAVGKMNLIPGE